MSQSKKSPVVASNMRFINHAQTKMKHHDLYYLYHELMVTFVTSDRVKNVYVEYYFFRGVGRESGRERSGSNFVLFIWTTTH